MRSIKVDKKTLIFHIINYTALEGMVRLCDKASQIGHKCILLLEKEIKPKGNYKNILLEVSDKKESRYSILIKKILNYFNIYNFDKIIQEWIDTHKKNEEEIENIFKKINPDAIFVYGDRHGLHEPAIIQVSKKMGIKVIIPPIAYKTGFEGILASRRKFLNKQTVVTKDKIFKNQYPGQWTYDNLSKEDICFYEKWNVIAREKCDILPKNPWTLGSTGSVFVCAEGELDKRRLMNHGVKTEKILLTGSLEHDMLFEKFNQQKETKEKLEKAYRLDSKKSIILIALPQTFEHGYLSFEKHWELQENICSQASKSGHNILISLHPKMKWNIYKFLEKKYSVKIIREKLAEVLPAVDIFIVGQGSSTIPLALLCELPIIIIDSYGLNFSRYDWIISKTTIKCYNQLYEAIKNIIDNDQKIARIKKNHASQKELISPFDGKCVDRIFNFLK